MPNSPKPIEDYALIGDCESAALVGKDGSIDWLCVPRFDSPACFAAILGTPENGRWLIRPVGEVKEVRRQYRDDTMVLETEHRTAAGSVTVIDFMSPHMPGTDLIRIVTGTRGTVEMELKLTYRFGYGKIVPWVRQTDQGLLAVAGPDALLLRTPVELKGEGMQTVARFTVHEGDRIPFALNWHASHEAPSSPADPELALKGTEAWWTEWASRSTYSGEWRAPVVRSLVTLKALTYAPTGGVVAAPTASLPESVGGTRNWDYRYCWVRDATFTLYALMTGGYLSEARQWREWLLRAIAGKPDQVQIMYGIAGERNLTEYELDWLPGYAGSQPVRVGNGAHVQLQLDTFGEIMDGLYFARRSGLEPEQHAWEVQKAFMDFLESAWDRPDAGIWEVRGQQRHFTHSKVMAWIAFDRAVKTVEKMGLDGPVDRWRNLRDGLRSQIHRNGFNPQEGSFVQSYGSEKLDASLLMLPLVGFIDASDERMIGTVSAIQNRLMADGFVQRYEAEDDVDGFTEDEGAFVVCTLWLADNLALQGRTDEARKLFESVLAIRNDVGLLSEEYDPKNRRFLGNFPQAYSHVGLINTARNLDRPGGPAERRAGT